MTGVLMAAPSAPAARALGPEQVAQLAREGWCQRDGFLGPVAILEALAAAVALDALGGLTEAAVGRGAQRTVAPAIRGDRTCWLNDHLDTPAFAGVYAAFEALREQLNEVTWLGMRETSLQLACFPGGGAGYDWHLDASRGGATRKMTAILYLNPTWQPADGGALHLDLPPVVLAVDPTLDHLVVFLSEEIRHAVMPSTAPRWAITAWFGALDPARPAL